MHAKCSKLYHDMKVESIVNHYNETTMTIERRRWIDSNMYLTGRLCQVHSTMFHIK